ncbi:uncharacterized protein LOC144135159 [Amblyomma americanum]
MSSAPSMGPGIYRWHPEKPCAGKSTHPAAAQRNGSGAPRTAVAAAVPAAPLTVPGQGLPSSGPPPPRGGHQGPSAADASGKLTGTKPSGVFSDTQEKTTNAWPRQGPAQERPNRILCLSMTLLILSSIMVILAYVNITLYHRIHERHTEEVDEGDSNMDESTARYVDRATRLSKRINSTREVPSNS